MNGAITLAEQIAQMHPKGVRTLAHIKLAADMTTDQALRWGKTVQYLGWFGGRPRLTRRADGMPIASTGEAGEAR